jgi:nucleotide-binding universal stress UspA family protein
MNYLVALTALGGRDAISLGRMLARTGDVTLTVCVVVPQTWDYPSPARVDAEYAAFLNQYTEDVIAEAREFLGDAVRAEYTSTSASSTTEGLIATATETGATLVALGSAQHGPLGRFTVGGIANEMLHISPVPVALAPRGYRPSSDARLRRVTCAFSGSTQSRSAFDAAVQLSRRHHVPLRLNPKGEVEQFGTSQPLLGAFEDVGFTTENVYIRPGVVVLAVTDGVTERRSNSDMLGDEGLMEIFSGCAGLTAQAVISRIDRELESATGRRVMHLHGSLGLSNEMPFSRIGICGGVGLLAVGPHGCTPEECDYVEFPLSADHAQALRDALATS